LSHSVICPQHDNVAGLHGSITQTERLKALEQALQVLSHNNEDLHNFELELGADKVLCLKLGYTVASASNDECCISQEVSLISQCLLQLYKCSEDHRIQSFRNVGATELIPLLIQTCSRVMHNRFKRHPNTMTATGTSPADGMLDVMKVFRVFAKISSAKSVLINGMKSKLLGLMLREAAMWLKDSRSPSFHSTEEVIMEMLGLVKDLTFRSQANDKRALMRSEKGILSNILTWCCEKIEGMTSKVQEWVTAVLWNLVLDPVTREQLLAQIGMENFNETITKGLLRVLIPHSEERRTSAIATRIKRNAISTLGNIVSDWKWSDMALKNLDNSLALLPKLTKLVQTDDDSIVRRRAMRTIRCVAHLAKDKEKPTSGWSKCLSADFFVSVLLRNDINGDENDCDTQIQACQTIVIMSSSLSPDDLPGVPGALVKRIETTTHPKLIEAASRCLAELIAKRAWSPQSLDFSDNFWKRLETLVAIDKSGHEDISLLFLQIAKAEARESDAAERNAASSSILTCYPALNALTSILSSIESHQDLSRDRAVQVVLTLVQNDANKKSLAENEGLLSGLVNLCLLHPKGKNKDLAKQVILDLVPEI
jgi:hypothetical protein